MLSSGPSTDVATGLRRDTSDGAQSPATRRFHLLKLCARTNPAPHPALREALEAGIDWHLLVEEASYQGVLPLLYHHLKPLAEPLVPRDVLNRTRARVGAHTLHGTCLAQELDRLSGLFHEAAIPVVAIKGIPLAHNLYGGYVLRPFGDTDLLIRRRDFERLHALLVAEGYGCELLDPMRQWLYLLVHAQREFVNRTPVLGGTTSVLDVHTSLLPFGYSYREPFERLWARTVPFELAHHSVRVLPPVDLLVVLCFHGFKNRWEALKYTVDVAELVRTYPDLDWAQVQGRAVAMRGARVLHIALLLAADLLEAPIPPSVLETARRDARAVRMTQRLAERLPSQPYREGDPLGERVRFNLDAQDSWRGKLRYGGYTLVRRLSELVLPSES